VLAENVALLWPAWIEALAGTVTTTLLLLSDTDVMAAAFWFSVTVQVLEALLPNVDGVHDKDVSCAGATRFRVLVRVMPPALAVTIAAWLLLTCAAVAVKLPLVCPAATVTLTGTVRLASSLEREIANPPDGAAAVKDTAHGVLAGVLRVVVVQLRPLNEAAGAGSEIVPEPPLAGIEVPPTVEATTPVI